MKYTMLLSECEITEIKIINEKVTNGGMSTDEMIKQLDAIPFEQFQDELHEKIINFKG